MDPNEHHRGSTVHRATRSLPRNRTHLYTSGSQQPFHYRKEEAKREKRDIWLATQLTELVLV
jgi:hypothetical protein